MKTIKTSALVFAFCISATICIAQRDFSGICSLGDLKTGSKLLDIDTLRLNCSEKSLVKFKQYSDKLNSLNCLILEGDTDPETWEQIFAEVKSISSVKSIVFNSNSFSALPYGFEHLYNNIQQLAITNNDNIDYYQALQQLRQLPNVNELKVDVYSVLDLPDSIFYLNTLSKIVLVNDDFGTVGRDETIPPVAYDFSVNRTNNSALPVKYVSQAGSMNGEEYEELSNYFKTLNPVLDTVMSSAFAQQLYIPQYNYVKPPIAGLDVERNMSAINPAVANVLTYPSGTKILIPANAFVDKAGKPVKENVTVSYREFRDPVDFLVSGIPMKYDSGGVVNNFESAGMFELYASIETQPLQLASGKQIKMNFVATSDDSSFNFYSFNDSTGNWDYKNRPKAVIPTEKIGTQVLSNAYLNYKSYMQLWGNYAPARPQVVDSSTFNDRFESFNYLHTTLLEGDSKHLGFPYFKDGERHYKNMAKLLRITNVRRTRQGDVLFKLKWINEAHPELVEFRDVYFRITDKTIADKFKKEYANKKFYNDVRLVQNGNNELEMRLKGAKDYKTITASAVMLDDKGKIKEIKNFNTRIIKYNKRLKRRAKEFSRKQKKNAYRERVPISDPDKLSVEAYKQSRQLMSKEEKKMNYDEWINYNNKVMDNERLAVSNSAATKDNFIRSLSLDNMGIYNCDQIQRLNNPVTIFADYKRKQDQRGLSPKSIYVIDKKVNAVMQYDGYKGYGPDKIAFCNNASAQNVLLAVNADGTMAIYKTEDFKMNDFRNKQHFVFRVEELGDKYSTVGELRKCIGL